MKTIKEKLEKIHNYDFDKEMIFVEDVLKLIDKLCEYAEIARVKAIKKGNHLEASAHRGAIHAGEELKSKID